MTPPGLLLLEQISNPPCQQARGFLERKSLKTESPGQTWTCWSRSLNSMNLETFPEVFHRLYILGKGVIPRKLSLSFR